MKVTREYILGLGSGLVLSALIMFAMQWSGIGVISDINRETAGQNAAAEKQTAESGTNTNDNSAIDKEATAETNSVNVSSDNTAEKNTVSSEKISFIVPDGASASSISDLLEQQGIITEKQAFMDAAGQLNVANKFQTGTFTLQRGQSVYEIIGTLIQDPQ